jgi:hypothetical protein
VDVRVDPTESADATLPPTRKKLASIPIDSRFSTDHQIEVSISTILGVGCKPILQFDSLGPKKTIKPVCSPTTYL